MKAILRLLALLQDKAIKPVKPVKPGSVRSEMKQTLLGNIKPYLISPQRHESNMPHRINHEQTSL